MMYVGIRRALLVGVRRLYPIPRSGTSSPPCESVCVRRARRRILEATAVAAVISGAPSLTWALVRTRSPSAALGEGLRATRAIGTLVGPGREGLLAGAAAHAAVSVAVGELLGLTLPRERSVAWGAVAGLVVGWVNLAVIAPRRYPAVSALPLGPQLCDNTAFGVVFAVVADR